MIQRSRSGGEGSRNYQPALFSNLSDSQISTCNNENTIVADFDRVLRTRSRLTPRG